MKAGSLTHARPVGRLLDGGGQVSMNDFARIAMSFDNKDLPIKNIPGPQGACVHQAQTPPQSLTPVSDRSLGLKSMQVSVGATATTL